MLIRFSLLHIGIIISLLGSVELAFAQCPADEHLKITSTLYSQENGLLSTILINIAQDTNGYRYFKGVDDNWIRYDGINFSMQESFNNTFFSEYGHGDMYNPRRKSQFFNQAGHTMEEGIDGTKYRWTIIKDSLSWTNLVNNQRLSLLLPEGLMNTVPSIFPNGEKCWLLARDQMYLFDLHSKLFQAVEFPTSITGVPHRMVINSEGSVFLIMENAIYQWNGADFSILCTYPRLQLGSMEIIMNRYLFISGSNGGMHEIDLERRSFRTLQISDYFHHPNLSAFSIHTLANYKNYLLICTSNAGLFIFNRCTNNFQHFVYDKSDAPDASVNASMWMAVDQDQIVWWQTEAGLIKLEIDQQLIRSYLPSTIMAGGVCKDCNNVRTIHPLDKDHLLLGTLGGVYQFNLSTRRFSWFLSLPPEEQVPQHSPVSSITGDGKGTIFIGRWLNSGIQLVNTRGKLLGNILSPATHPDISFENLHILFYDSKNVLWVGTNNGVVRVLNPDQFVHLDSHEELKIENHVPLHNNASYKIHSAAFSIIEDANNNIWIGTRDGLYIYNSTSKVIRHYEHHIADSTSLSDSEVRSIYISANKDVWIGTKNGGLNRFDQQSEKFVAYTTAHGLPNNSIYTILEDKNGFLWLGTNGGLCRFRPSDLAVRNYTPRDGIQHFEFNTNAVAVTDDGMFCFGGRAGLNLFHPDSMNITTSASPVAITKFMILDKEFPVTQEILHLPSDQNTFTFDFATLNYYRSNDNQYAYQLEGVDKDWIQSGNRTFTNYSSLPPGTYTFKVRAANYTGTWHPDIASVRFIIHPPWYNTWWFRLAMLLGIAGGLYVLYRYRLYQVTKFYGLRNRIASDLHDEIGSTLSSISMSSTIIQQKLNGQHTDVTRLLHQVSKNTDDMMEALSDIVWAIHTRNDRFDNVLNRMRAFAIEVLEPAGIDMQFDIRPDLLNIHLDMQQRKNVYLIFKEAINNILKYAACTHVSIRMERLGTKRWMMEIVDDGIGFEKAFVKEISLSGNGIRNMQKRAEEVNGSFELHSSPGHGVKVKVTFTL